ncbi:hypothetical protein NDU88_001723 [Pleurodeles waltl]|uniref:Uncharacterized protein n=1 Tax=Pleurodeles waltl TaxID=8319 RepID=A0AAV7TJ26_PLEWA|nr:hypothetical protein NDU88_001723 [Pleurodeles waltl]
MGWRFGVETALRFVAENSRDALRPVGGGAAVRSGPRRGGALCHRTSAGWWSEEGGDRGRPLELLVERPKEARCWITDLRLCRAAGVQWKRIGGSSPLPAWDKAEQRGANPATVHQRGLD